MNNSEDEVDGQKQHDITIINTTMTSSEEYTITNQAQLSRGDAIL